MYSQCPSCKARFRVTAATLRAAHGRARCGKCGHEFDVLAHLSDEPPRARAAHVDPLKSATAPPTLSGAFHKDQAADPAAAADEVPDHALDDYHFSAEDIEKVFIDARDWQKQYGSGGRTSTLTQPEPSLDEASEVEVEEPESVEDITLEGLKVDIASQTGESLHLEAEFDYLDDEPDDLAETTQDADEDEESDDSEEEPEELDDEEAYDLDSTSRLRALKDVPESAYPDDDASAAAGDDDETAFYRALIEGRELPAPPPAGAAAQERPGASAGSPRSGAAPVASAARAESTASSRPSTLSSPAVVTPIRAEIRPTPAQRWSEARRSRTTDEDDLADLDLTQAALPSKRADRWLAIGGLLLALVLAAQVIHHWRQAIVRHPQAGEALRRVYAVLGQPLSPNWDLDAFEVRQWGPTVDVAPGEPLTVRASVTNRAAHAQPYPLLRLEFEDRFGTAVAQRDFLPAEYLKSASQAARLIAAGETTEAELSVVAPDGDAVGYTLDICLREGASQIRCAHGDG